MNSPKQAVTVPAGESARTQKCGAVLVCGGGIAGIQASLDLAAAGFYVYLVEQSPTIGGGMARLDKTFPTGDCATCIISPKLVECLRDLNIEVLTMAEVEALEGVPGDFTVSIRQHPRSVDPEKCTGCGDCWQSCPVRNYPATVRPFQPASPLRESETTQLNEILSRHLEEPGPLLPILQDINEACGYLPRPLLERVALRLETPLAEILRVASFYNAFSLEPVGRHVMEVCLGTACFVRGSGILLEHLENELDIPAGGTDTSRRFTLRTVRCIGCCALAPALRVDGITFGKVKIDQVSSILGRFE